MKVEPFGENQICNLISPGSLGIDEKYNFAKAVSRAAQADALRQVIEFLKKGSPGFLIPKNIAYLQSALSEIEKEVKC